MITNENQIKEKMVKMTNKDIEASNNKKEAKNKNNVKENDELIYNDEIFGYDNEGDNNNIIINKKNLLYETSKKNDLYTITESQIRMMTKELCEADNSPIVDEDDDNEIYNSIDKKESSSEEKFNFDEFILSQDVIEGNWTKDSQCEILIEQEKDIYKKIKEYSENKKIKDENGIITLFILYYIYNKKSDKVSELKFVINKAKKYLKKIFKLEYDEIIKEIPN